MTTARKIALGLFASSWLALIAALVGALRIPEYHCYGDMTPAGLLTVEAAVPAAGLTLFAAVLVESAADDSLRATIVKFAIFATTFAAGIGILFLADAQTGSWGCG